MTDLRRILVVEDDPDGQALVAHVLQYLNLPIDVAGDAEQAMDFLLQDNATYRAVIVDLALPGRDGWELLADIQKTAKTSKLPCVAVTAFHTSIKGFWMGYQFSWHVPQRVMYLKLSTETTLQEFEEINKTIMGNLNELKERLCLVIDVTEFKPDALVWDRIRASQLYVTHENLDYALVIGQKTNRLLRLMMLVLFNVSRAGLKFFENLEEANTFLDRFVVTR
jgi:hypothetical protein